MPAKMKKKRGNPCNSCVHAKKEEKGFYCPKVGLHNVQCCMPCKYFQAAHQPKGGEG